MFRGLFDASVTAVMEPMYVHLQNCVKTFSEAVSTFHDFYKMVHVSDSDPAVPAWNAAYRALIQISVFLRIFTDSFSSASMRTVNAVLQAFPTDSGLALLSALGKCHQLAQMENIKLKHHLPKKWFEKEDSTSASDVSLEETGEVKVAKRVRFLLAQVCLVMPSFLQSTFLSFKGERD